MARISSFARYKSCLMGEETLPSLSRKRCCLKNCTVSGFSTDILEVQANEPSMNVILIPGNPGVISFYKEFVEALYDILGGSVSITAIAHLSHSRKDLASGRMFSIHEQIDHKVNFIMQEIQNRHLPLILVGHSIGSYICMEIFKKLPEQVVFSMSLYPFVTLNKESLTQHVIGVLARSSLLSVSVSYLVAFFGSFPVSISSALVRTILGSSWSETAVDAAGNALLKYHTMRNALFMAKTEFEELSAEPDWAFMKENEKKIAFLFGVDDHWGPLSLFHEISKRVPGASLSIESEGHSHAFACTQAGSVWVAQHVANFVRNQVLK